MGFSQPRWLTAPKLLIKRLMTNESTNLAPGDASAIGLRPKDP